MKQGHKTHHSSLDNSKTLAPCIRCGAIVPGGTTGCRTLFEEVLALEYSDPAYGAVHLLTVDAHVLQHSEDHGPRSNVFHLIRLCWLLEHGSDRRQGSPRLPGLAGLVATASPMGGKLNGYDHDTIDQDCALLKLDMVKKSDWFQIIEVEENVFIIEEPGHVQRAIW